MPKVRTTVCGLNSFRYGAANKSYGTLFRKIFVMKPTLISSVVLLTPGAEIVANVHAVLVVNEIIVFASFVLLCLNVLFAIIYLHLCLLVLSILTSLVDHLSEEVEFSTTQYLILWENISRENCI